MRQWLAESCRRSRGRSVSWIERIRIAKNSERGRASAPFFRVREIRGVVKFSRGETRIERIKVGTKAGSSPPSAVKRYHATIRHCRVFRVEIVLLLLAIVALMLGIVLLLR